MKHLLEFPFNDGTKILFEVNQSEGNIHENLSGKDSILKASETFENVIERIKPVTKVLIDKLSHIDNQPHQIEVEFGIKLDFKAGIIFASIGSEVNFNIHMTWNPINSNILKSNTKTTENNGKNC